jgi:hypothetical protein
MSDHNSRLSLYQYTCLGLIPGPFGQNPLSRPKIGNSVVNFTFWTPYYLRFGVFFLPIGESRLLLSDILTGNSSKLDFAQFLNV